MYRTDNVLAIIPKDPTKHAVMIFVNMVHYISSGYRKAML